MITDKHKIGDLTIFVHEYESSEQELLLEAKDKGIPIDNQYSYKKHPPHNPTGEYHLHVYKKGNEIFSINKSGRGHDGYSGTRIPNEVYSALKDKFPSWQFSEDQIVESMQFEEQSDPRRHLRKVLVFNGYDSYEGYFHCFGNDPFSTGGNGGWKDKTVAIIESEDGEIKKISISGFKFKDV